MKAATYKTYGAASVLKVEDMPRPTPKDDEILVQVFATSVTTADWRLRASAFPGISWPIGRLMFGLFRPRNPVLGADFAGRVVAKGRAVRRFKGGDEVFGTTGMAMGAHAQYVVVSGDGVVAPKPRQITYAQAAAVPFGAIASLIFLRDFGKIKPGDKVLVNGASGGMGVFAVQLAKHFGAEVTGVCSADNADLVRGLGADHVIDYKAEDFTQSDRRYDIILDTVGKTRFRECRRVLSPKGVYLPVEFGLREAIQSCVTGILGGKRVVIGVSGETQDDLAIVKALLDGEFIRPVIDRVYPLGAVAEAHARVESRHKTGAIILEPEMPEKRMPLCA